MNNKKLLIINITTLIIFIVVVGIGLNQSNFTKADPDHIDEELIDEKSVKEIEKVTRKTSLKKSILKFKFPTTLLGSEDELEDEEKDLMELDEEDENLNNEIETDLDSNIQEN